jgi:acetyl-CoA carboxylase biotin carboxylase subunit
VTIRRVLIANRGEIAVRIIRACHELGMEAVAIYSDADEQALHVKLADHAVRVGPPSAAKSYLSIEAVLGAAREMNVAAVHPGYGFLSENARFAREVIAAGFIWVGPAPDIIELMGDKAAAREAAMQAGLPVVRGTGIVEDVSVAASAAAALGYPVLLKAAAGGGGRGIRRVDSEAGLEEAFAQAQREVVAAFGETGLYLEKALLDVRHVEIQVLADSQGGVIHLFERDCSLQRRRQKLIEETPAPLLSGDCREAMCTAAVKLARSVGYTSAGTVEFLVDEDESFYFIEMNTRIQVEHGISEMLTGIDLVRHQLLIAYGEPLGIDQEDVVSAGAVIEIRINAEDPDNGFMGSPGRLELCRFAAGPGVRIDSGVEQESEIQPFYDSMIAKVMVHAEDRPAAIARALRALAETHIEGVQTTVRFGSRVLATPEFRDGRYSTSTIERLLEEWAG